MAHNAGILDSLDRNVMRQAFWPQSPVSSTRLKASGDRVKDSID